VANLVTAPVTPAIPLLKKQDYPDSLGTQEGLDKFFTLINPFFQQLGNALNGSLSIGNMNGEIISFQITTPTTDWVPITLASGWTSTLAQSNGFAPPRYRINSDGQIQLSGACEHNAAFTIPGTVIASGGLPATQFNESFTSWTEQFDGAGTHIQAGGSLLQVNPNGSLTLAGFAFNTFAQVGTANSILFQSLDNVFYTPLSVVPRTLSCFPKQVRLVGQQQPVDVWLTACTDANNQALAPGSAALGLAPGCVSWQRVNSIQQTGVNLIQINNIAGLVLGRTYNVRCWVQYSGGTGAASAGVGQAQASSAGSNG
jgi:hypothetical protein